MSNTRPAFNSSALPAHHPLARLRHHVSGAIERGEGVAVAEIKAPSFVLWGRHKSHGPQWLKLSDWTNAEQKRRERAGWECQKLLAGLHPLDHKKA